MSSRYQCLACGQESNGGGSMNPEKTDQYMKDHFVDNPYLAHETRIKKIIDETAHVKTFVMENIDGQYNPAFDFIPGQFAIWSLPGIGEAPFSYSCHGDSENKEMQFTIHKIGSVTSAIFKYQVGDIVEIRGPYGNGFPMDSLIDKDLIFIMGGIGAAPLRGVLHHVLEFSESYGNICVLHGAKTPQDMVFKEEFLGLAGHETVRCLLTVDNIPEDDSWEHSVGVVTDLFNQNRYDDIDPSKTIAMICGPPIMYKFVIMELEKLNIPQDQILMTLERRMKCGIGKCGHCAIDGEYACTDGPVFNYWDAKSTKEMI